MIEADGEGRLAQETRGRNIWMTTPEENGAKMVTVRVDTKPAEVIR